VSIHLHKLISVKITLDPFFPTRPAPTHG